MARLNDKKPSTRLINQDNNPGRYRPWELDLLVVALAIAVIASAIAFFRA